MATTQYIGARYVPLFAEPIEWDKTKQYEPLTIVTHNGNSYTSRQFVPIGIEITNESFWALTGNFNAQVEQYRKEVKAYDGRITTAQDTADSAKTTADAATTAASEARTAADNASAAVASEKTRAEAKEAEIKSLAETNENGIANLDSQMAATTESELLTRINNEVNRATNAEHTLQANANMYSNDYFSNKIKTEQVIDNFPFNYTGFYIQSLAIDDDTVYIGLKSNNLPTVKSKIVKCTGFNSGVLVYQSEVNVPNVTHVNSLCIHNGIMYTCGVESNELQFAQNRGYIDRINLSTFTPLDPIVFPCSGGLSDITVWTSGDVTFIGGSANDNNGYVVSELVDDVVSAIYTYNEMPTHINYRQGGCFYRNQYYLSLNSGGGYSNAYIQVYIINNNCPCAVLTTDIPSNIECEDIKITNDNLYILNYNGIYKIANIKQYMPQYLTQVNGASTNLISCVNNAPAENIKLKYIASIDSYTLAKNGAGPLKWKLHRKILTGNNVYIAGDISNGRTIILPFEQVVIDTHPSFEAQYFVGDIVDSYTDNNNNNIAFKIYVAKIDTNGAYSRTTNNSADASIKLSNLRIYSSEYV